jgi:hypothetical protein
VLHAIAEESPRSAPNSAIGKADSLPAICALPNRKELRFLLIHIGSQVFGPRAKKSVDS